MTRVVRRLVRAVGLLFVAVAAVLCTYGPGFTAPLPPGVSDSLTVFDPTGSIFAQVTATEADEITNGPGQVYIIPMAGLVDSTQFGNATTLFESGNPSFSSDIFGIASLVAGCLDPNGLCLGFSSDTETLPQPFGTFPINLPEGNGVFDATMYLTPDFQAQGFTAQFVSDSEVPAPPSLVLLGLGVLVAMRWMRPKEHALL